MRKLVFAAALAIVGIAAPNASADGSVFPPAPPCNGPFCNHHPNPVFSGFLAHVRGGQVLPVFQAAPWYLYWPYDAHFLTAAPIGGAYYAPPIMGNYPVQPYFPAPQENWMPPAAYAPAYGPTAPR
jgi:hypothetical protein